MEGGGVLVGVLVVLVGGGVEGERGMKAKHFFDEWGAKCKKYVISSIALYYMFSIYGPSFYAFVTILECNRFVVYIQELCQLFVI